MRDQRIRDPIHNLIKFSASRDDDQVLWELVQTREFQRLRRIKQLGFSELVYPGATHTRFSHALGAMQMARNILAVFRRNDVVGKDPDQKEWQTATLCAALLHDIGHGPFSHVFEEVSKRCGLHIHHEEWTSRIIGESAVSQILEKASPALRSKTLAFFQQEPGYNVYSSIVSSQLDADRLDFLLRDRYFTGIHFGSIDTEWIFDCLSVQEVNADPNGEVQQYSFVVAPKGLAAVENYLYAYSELYSKVYFHKTTRAAQIMLEEILTGIISKPEFLQKLPSDNAVKRYFELGKSATLESYIDLDDSALWSVVLWAAKNECGDSSALARRLIDRDLFKCFEPPHPPTESLNILQVNEFAKKLSAAGIWAHRDKIPEKGYKTFSGDGMVYLKNILVYNERDKSPCAITSMSRLVSEMPDPPAIRFYFRSAIDRNAAAALWG